MLKRLKFLNIKLIPTLTSKYNTKHINNQIYNNTIKKIYKAYSLNKYKYDILKSYYNLNFFNKPSYIKNIKKYFIFYYYTTHKFYKYFIPVILFYLGLSNTIKHSMYLIKNKFILTNYSIINKYKHIIKKNQYIYINKLKKNYNIIYKYILNNYNTYIYIKHYYNFKYCFKYLIFKIL